MQTRRGVYLVLSHHSPCTRSANTHFFLICLASITLVNGEGIVSMNTAPNLCQPWLWAGKNFAGRPGSPLSHFSWWSAQQVFFFLTFGPLLLLGCLFLHFHLTTYVLEYPNKTMSESVSSEMCWNEKKKNPSKTFNFPLIVGQLSVCTPDLSYASVSGGATVSGAKADCAECNIVQWRL